MRLLPSARKGPLTRFFLLNTRWLGVYLHRIDRPDADRECHDHPWSFVSLVLRGGYREERLERGATDETVRRRFSLAFRRWADAHRIVSVRPSTWTLILRGRDSGVWGFWVDAGDGGQRWVYWREFEATRAERAPMEIFVSAADEAARFTRRPS